jgi:hypothetical protein
MAIWPEAHGPAQSMKIWLDANMARHDRFCARVGPQLMLCWAPSPAHRVGPTRHEISWLDI